MMRAKIKTTAVMLTIIIVLLCFTVENIKIAHPQSTGGNIDLFTQKEPYSGKGPNVQSDAFSPGEEVQIYALVTYNDCPVERFLVAFQVLGPENELENITFCRVALTNDMGIAKISFRILHLNETTFGEWLVIGNVQIGNSTFQDSVKFKVGWLVEIVSIETVNERYIVQDSFVRGSYVGVRLALRNIALTEKAVTVSLTIYDCLNNYVNSTEIIDIILPSNTTSVRTYFLYIPKNTKIGIATLYACAFTAPFSIGGLPYCPEVSSSFSIVANMYFLKVKTEPASIFSIPGEGWYTECVNVNLTAPVFVRLFNGTKYVFSHWDVDDASYSAGENSIIVFMDMNHTATAHYVQAFTLTIAATVGGSTTPTPGTYEYPVNTTVQVIATSEANYVFDHWELDGVNVGSANPYMVLMDKDHTLKAIFSPAVAGWFIPEWFYWILFLFLLFLIALMGILLYRRRRKKFKEAFSSGWTAWYYGYNLRNKDRKF